MKLIDLHTHHPAGGSDVLEMESLFPGRRASGKTPFFSAGLHPRYLTGEDLATAESWLREHAAEPGCLAVGEAGLDKLTGTPWTLQVEAFALCIAVAADTRKPLVIHCVKAYAEVLALLKKAADCPPAIFHGFDKHPQTARMLLDAGCFLSFGYALFKENSHAAEALRQTPADRFFLETDDRTAGIAGVYTRAAEIREVSVEQLAQQIGSNFEALWPEVAAKFSA